MNAENSPYLLSRKTRIWLTILWFLLSALVPLFVIRLTLAPYYRPPFEFETPVVLSETALCPGESLTYQITLHINDVPTLAVNARTVWSVDRGITVTPDTAPRYVIWREVGTIRAEVMYPIPELPPGNYEVRSGTAGIGQGTTAYAVGFRIPEGCG